MGKNSGLLREQLQEQRRKVDFDSYDLTTDDLVRRISSQRIDIAPEYQRQFRWDEERQSALIESIMLGIPVPNLFMATTTNPDEPSVWEVVDGLQRSLSIANFICSDPEERERMRLSPNPLRLKGLAKIESANGSSFQDLPQDIQTLFLDRPIKITVLNDKSDKQVRFDLFERLNTGGISLTDQEVRDCIYRGPFLEMISQLAESDLFSSVVLLTKKQMSDGTAQEYVLRFFAFLHSRDSFDHSVKDFLNKYTAENYNEVDALENLADEFNRTFAYLQQCFPSGVTRHAGGARKQGTTPVNFFEGIAVGAALALREKSNLPVCRDVSWTTSEEFDTYTKSATNSRPKVFGRINYAKERFLKYEDA